MSKLDDFIEECRKAAEANPLPAPAPDPEKQKQIEFFFGKPPERNLLEEAWAEAGRCPDCGERGYVSLSAFVCTIHGVYDAKLKE